MVLVPGGVTRRNNWINMGRNRGNTVLGAKRQQAIETIRYQVKMFNISEIFDCCTYTTYIGVRFSRTGNIVMSMMMMKMTMMMVMTMMMTLPGGGCGEAEDMRDAFEVSSISSNSDQNTALNSETILC